MVFLLAVPVSTHASFCAGQSWLREWSHSDRVVFVGRLLEAPVEVPKADVRIASTELRIDSSMEPDTFDSCVFLLERSWRGSLPDTVRLVGPIRLTEDDVGRSFVVEAIPSEDPRWDVYRRYCWFRRPIDEADLDLLTLDLLERHLGASSGTPIHGDVETATDAPPDAQSAMTKFADEFVELMLSRVDVIGVAQLPRIQREGAYDVPGLDPSERPGWSTAWRGLGEAIPEASTRVLEDMLERLEPQLDDPANAEGIVSLVALANGTSVDAIGWLVDATHHRDPAVRRAVVEALTNARLTFHVPALRTAVVERIDDSSLEVAAAALAVYGGSRNTDRDACLDALAPWYETVDSPLHVAAGVTLCSWIGSELPDEITTRLLVDSSPEVREAALEAVRGWLEVSEPVGMLLLSWLDDPARRGDAVEFLIQSTCHCPAVQVHSAEWLPKLDADEASEVITRTFRLCADALLPAMEFVSEPLLETALTTRASSSSELFEWQVRTGLASPSPERRRHALEESSRAWPPDLHLEAIYMSLPDGDPVISSRAVELLRLFNDAWIEEGIRRLEAVRARNPVLAGRIDSVVDSLRVTLESGEATQGGSSSH
ncbi:MAG: hypothetical protein KDA27_11735 [Candidatus Eisenbacteria bacterium]|uniref:Uncharacterized protein n=1 Tax=Eiseniibacteriota bacterium TaxID=2212470 RepID=A0A956NGE1_UNCEI|nr:hypothetical protein [Candidatus Eisenbacteria bacterium]